MARKRSRSSIVDVNGAADPSQLARSPSSSSLGWRKVCIVSSCSSWGLYIIDLMKNPTVDFTATCPMIRVDDRCFISAAFCVLGSTLYAFEGYHNNWDSLTARSKERGNKSAYTYELPSSQVSDLLLEKSMLREVPAMNHYKYSPIATPTPDEKKILLFSTAIKFDIPLADKCDFELYDPATQKWHQLPGISRPEEPGSPFFSYIRVYSFSFTGPSVLLLQTDIGFCSLDFLHGKCWEISGNFHGAGRVPGSGSQFVVIGSDLCLTPTMAYDINPDRDIGHTEYSNVFDTRFFFYPELCYFPNPKYSKLTSHIALLDDCHFCILQTGIASDTMRAHLTLDVCTFDLTKCTDKLRRFRSKKKERVLPGSTVVKSFKFFVEDQLPLDSFYPVSFSSIPPPTTA